MATKGFGQPVEEALPVVMDLRGLAVHEVGRSDDVAPEDLADALVAEADAQDRELAGQGADGVQRHAPVLRASRSRRNQQGVGSLRPDPLDVDGVVAEDDGAAPSSPSSWTRL